MGADASNIWRETADAADPFYETTAVNPIFNTTAPARQWRADLAWQLELETRKLLEGQALQRSFSPRPEHDPAT